MYKIFPQPKESYLVQCTH